MRLFPVVQRELLVAARERMTYLSRTVSAGILLPLFAALHSLHGSQPAFGGLQILSVLSTIVFIECMLAGVRYTSDCISEERREGTLGLLFLTDLSAIDVVLGKVFARGLRAFFSLVATLPILAVTVFMGGVTGSQIFAISVTLVVCILFSLAAGTAISSRGYRERNVLIGTTVFLLGITFLPVALNAVAIRVFRFYGLMDTILLVSPYYAFSEAGRGFVRHLPTALLLLLAVSAVLLFYSAWRVRRTFAETVPAREIINPKPRRGLRQRYFNNALAWLAARGRIRRRWIVQFILLVLAFAMFSRVAVDARWNWAFPIVILGTFGLHVIFKFFLTAETCRQLNEDRRSGSLELLLVTPVKTAAIIRSQLHATWRTAFFPILGLMLLNYAWMSHHTFARDEIVNTVLPCSIILLVADAIVLPFRSLAHAIQGERYTITVFKVFIRTQGPPLAAVGIMLAMAIGANGAQTAANYLMVWTVLCLIYSAFMIRSARKQLSRFRAIASGEVVLSGWEVFLQRLSKAFSPASIPRGSRVQTG